MGTYFWTPCIMEYASTESVHYWKWAWLSILIVWIRVMCTACLLLLLCLVLRGVSTQHLRQPQQQNSDVQQKGLGTSPHYRNIAFKGSDIQSVYNVPNVIFDTGAKQCQCQVWWIHTTCGGSHPLLVMHASSASASDYTWCTIIDHLIALLLWWVCAQKLHGLAMATLLSHRPCQ